MHQLTTDMEFCSEAVYFHPSLSLDRLIEAVLQNWHFPSRTFLRVFLIIEALWGRSWYTNSSTEKPKNLSIFFVSQISTFFSNYSTTAVFALPSSKNRRTLSTYATRSTTGDGMFSQRWYVQHWTGWSRTSLEQHVSGSFILRVVASIRGGLFSVNKLFHRSTFLQFLLAAWRKFLSL